MKDVENKPYRKKLFSGLHTYKTNPIGKTCFQDCIYINNNQLKITLLNFLHKVFVDERNFFFIYCNIFIARAYSINSETMNSNNDAQCRYMVRHVAANQSDVFQVESILE